MITSSPSCQFAGVANGTANEGDQIRYEELRQFLQDRYMNAEMEDMFIIMESSFPTPKPARILQTLKCESCGEMTMESRTRRIDGKTLCLPCFEKREQKI